MRTVSATLFLFLCLQPCSAAEVEYRTGGPQYDRAWHAFYVVADHEPEIDDSLIAKGWRMVPAICEAIQHKDMKRRRYAIGALGYIGDRAALKTLETILTDDLEIDYFRGDALRSIYQIDRKLGLRYGTQYETRQDTLGQYAKAVSKREPWLLAPSKE
jgi:hypothetical protein